jgi:hypothetical protein
MASIEIKVPNLDDGQSGFYWLFDTSANLQSADGEVTFDFSDCRFIGQHAVAFLGGLARQLEAHGCVVYFLWDTLIPRVRNCLKQHGFLHAFGHPYKPLGKGNSIPFREDFEQDPSGYVQYLEQMWLGKNWIKVSERLGAAVASRVGEAYLNVFEHSRSPVGLFSCGQHFPNKHLLKLTLVDFGVGIPSNVRLHLLKTQKIPPDQLPGRACMEWAFQRGTSTQPGGRGLGLDLLSSFVRVNDGRLEIFSHEGHAIVTKAGVQFSSIERYFEGTLVNILLRCDEKYYCLTSERSEEFPF